MSSTSTRDYSLDAARGALMILGVFLHAANIYSTNGDWLISDPQQSSIFNIIVDFIHVFRMPAFFWISGYFCALTYQRNGVPGLFRTRLPRVLIPLLTTWATLNLAQKLFLASLAGQDLTEVLFTLIPIYHLWFLVDLAIFICIAALVLPRIKLYEGFGRKFGVFPLSLMLPILAAVSVITSLVARSTGFAYDSFFSLTSLYRLAEFGPYFAGGIFMFRHSNAKNIFMGVPIMLIFATLPLAIFSKNYTHSQVFFVAEFALFMKYLMVWMSISIVLNIFYIFLNKNNGITRFLSEAAYSIYLFHHIVVVMIGVALFNCPIAISLKFLIVVIGSLTISIFIHLVLVRNRTARLLFNGK